MQWVFQIKNEISLKQTHNKAYALDNNCNILLFYGYEVYSLMYGMYDLG